MKRSIIAGPASLLALSLLGGCHLPGKPGPDFVVQRPDEITNFETLYAQNCQACHGVRGKDGMAVSLASPAYIAYAGADHIAQVTTNGIGGSLMPAFAKSQGGLLSGQQVSILADGIVSKWGDPAAMGGAAPPPYESAAHGDANAGETLFKADCLHCHAPGAGSVLSPTYLALVSDVGLRTLLVTGRPAEGMPDWRGYPGGALNDQQLADIVAFLAGHRTPAPGQPLPNQRHSLPPSGSVALTLHQQQLAAQVGPATVGPKQSPNAAPAVTPKHPESVKP